MNSIIKHIITLKKLLDYYIGLVINICSINVDYNSKYKNNIYRFNFNLLNIKRYKDILNYNNYSNFNYYTFKKNIVSNIYLNFLLNIYNIVLFMFNLTSFVKVIIFLVNFSSISNLFFYLKNNKIQLIIIFGYLAYNNVNNLIINKFASISKYIIKHLISNEFYYIFVKKIKVYLLSFFDKNFNLNNNILIIKIIFYIYFTLLITIDIMTSNLILLLILICFLPIINSNTNYFNKIYKTINKNMALFPVFTTPLLFVLFTFKNSLFLIVFMLLVIKLFANTIKNLFSILYFTINNLYMLEHRYKNALKILVLFKNYKDMNIIISNIGSNDDDLFKTTYKQIISKFKFKEEILLFKNKSNLLNNLTYNKQINSNHLNKFNIISLEDTNFINTSFKNSIKIKDFSFKLSSNLIVKKNLLTFNTDVINKSSLTVKDIEDIELNKCENMLNICNKLYIITNLGIYNLKTSNNKLYLIKKVKIIENYNNLNNSSLKINNNLSKLINTDKFKTLSNLPNNTKTTKLTKNLFKTENIFKQNYQKAVLNNSSNIADIYLISDVSELIKNQQEIIDNKYKNYLTNKISHEIKTPLIASSSIIDILEINRKNNTIKGLNTELNLSKLNLINEIILFVAFEMNTLVNGLENFTYELEEIDINNLIDWCTSFLNFSIEASSLKSKVSVLKEKKINSIVESDSRSLKMILLHVLKNAVKYTKKGSISIKSYFENSCKKYVCLSIKDTGIGMNNENLMFINNTHKETVNYAINNNNRNHNDNYFNNYKNLNEFPFFNINIFESNECVNNTLNFKENKHQLNNHSIAQVDNLLRSRKHKTINSPLKLEINRNKSNNMYLKKAQSEIMKSNLDNFSIKGGISIGLKLIKYICGKLNIYIEVLSDGLTGTEFIFKFTNKYTLTKNRSLSITDKGKSNKYLVKLNSQLINSNTNATNNITNLNFKYNKKILVDKILKIKEYENSLVSKDTKSNKKINSNNAKITAFKIDNSKNKIITDNNNDKNNNITNNIFINNRRVKKSITMSNSQHKSNINSNIKSSSSFIEKVNLSNNKIIEEIKQNIITNERKQRKSILKLKNDICNLINTDNKTITLNYKSNIISSSNTSKNISNSKATLNNTNMLIFTSKSKFYSPLIRNKLNTHKAKSLKNLATIFKNKTNLLNQINKSNSFNIKNNKNKLYGNFYSNLSLFKTPERSFKIDSVYNNNLSISKSSIANNSAISSLSINSSNSNNGNNNYIFLKSKNNDTSGFDNNKDYKFKCNNHLNCLNKINNPNIIVQRHLTIKPNLSTKHSLINNKLVKKKTVYKNNLYHNFTSNINNNCLKNSLNSNKLITKLLNKNLDYLQNTNSKDEDECNYSDCCKENISNTQENNKNYSLVPNISSMYSINNKIKKLEQHLNSNNYTLKLSKVLRNQNLFGLDNNDNKSKILDNNYIDNENKIKNIQYLNTLELNKLNQINSYNCSKLKLLDFNNNTNINNKNIFSSNIFNFCNNIIVEDSVESMNETLNKKKIYKSKSFDFDINYLLNKRIFNLKYQIIFDISKHSRSTNCLKNNLFINKSFDLKLKTNIKKNWYNYLLDKHISLNTKQLLNNTSSIFTTRNIGQENKHIINNFYLNQNILDNISENYNFKLKGFKNYNILPSNNVSSENNILKVASLDDKSAMSPLLHTISNLSNLEEITLKTIKSKNMLNVKKKNTKQLTKQSKSNLLGLKNTNNIDNKFEELLKCDNKNIEEWQNKFLSIYNISTKDSGKTTILVVDDDYHCRNTLSNLVNIVIKSNKAKFNNFDVLKASDGIDILNYIYHDQQNKFSIKLVISDENMTVCNGSDAFQLLNVLFKTDKLKKIPLWILTALEDEYELSRIKTKCNCDLILKKPARKDKLRELLIKNFNNN